LSSVGIDAAYVGRVDGCQVQCADTISIIGLAGGLRGMLILSVPSNLLRRSYPGGDAPAPVDLADWLSELANLLLGRIKCRLLAHSVTIELSTPLIVSASEFRFERFASPPLVHEFSVAEQSLHVIFEAVDPGNAGSLAPRRDLPLRPGEMVMF
jgi:CheY-specific phosphatase CheX